MAGVRWLLVALVLLPGCRPARRIPVSRTDSTTTRPLAEAPVVRGPTVVAFWLQASDTIAKEGGADLLDDFRNYTARIAPALEEAEITLVATTADSVIVELAGGPRRVIALSGLDYPFGYVLVEPGYPETILTGVSTDDDLLDEVEWYFGLDEDLPDSSSGRVISTPAGSASVGGWRLSTGRATGLRAP